MKYQVVHVTSHGMADTEEIEADTPMDAAESFCRACEWPIEVCPIPDQEVRVMWGENRDEYFDFSVDADGVTTLG